MAEEPTAPTPPRAQRAAAPRLGFAERVFGYDVFVSFALGPPPRGTRAYAADLARRLREADFTVFFSEDEAPAGGALDATLRRALLRSRTLVVVLNRGTLAEPRWVRTEVETFRQAHPRRPVVPVSIGGAITDPALAEAARPWLQHDGRIWIDEHEAAWHEGRTSDDVVARLATAPRAVRASTRWRGLVGLTLAVLAGVATVAWLQRNAALASLRGATALRLVAEGEAMLAGTRVGGDERALWQLLVAHRLAPGPEVAGALQSAAVRHRDLLRFAALPGPVRDLAVDLPRRRLYVAAGAEGVHVLDWPSLAPAAPPIAAGRTVAAIALGADGTLLATADRPGATAVDPAGRRAARDASPVRIWDTRTGASVGAAPDFAGSTAMALAFTPDGAELIVAGNAEVRRFDPRSGTLLGATPLFTREAFVAMAIDGARREVLTGVNPAPSYRQAVLWRVDDGRPLATWSVDGCDTDVVAFSAGGQPLVGGGYADVFPNGFCALVAGNAGTRRWHGHAEPLTAVAVNGPTQVSGDAGGALIDWDASPAEPRPAGRAAQGHRGAVRVLRLLQEARQPMRIVSGGDDATLRIWRYGFTDPVGERNALGESAADSRRELRLNFRADGTATTEVVYPLRQQVFLLDARTGLAFGPSVDGNVGTLASIAVLPGGAEWFVVRAGRALRLRSDGRPSDALPLADPPARATAVAASPDGRILAAGDASGALHLWDAATGQRLHAPIAAHAGAVPALRFTPDGRRIATGSEDASVRLWDVRTGTAVGAALVGPEPVTAIEIDPDGATLAAGHRRAGVQFWDLASQRPIGSPLTASSDGELRGMAFEPGGRQLLVAAGRYGPRRLPAPAAWADVLCAKLARLPSEAELATWLPAGLPRVEPCPASTTAGTVGSGRASQPAQSATASRQPQ